MSIAMCVTTSSSHERQREVSHSLTQCRILARAQLSFFGKYPYNPQNDAAELMDGYRELVAFLWVLNNAPNETYERDLRTIHNHHNHTRETVR